MTFDSRNESSLTQSLHTKFFVTRYSKVAINEYFSIFATSPFQLIPNKLSIWPAIAYHLSADAIHLSMCSLLMRPRIFSSLKLGNIPHYHLKLGSFWSLCFFIQFFWIRQFPDKPLNKWECMNKVGSPPGAPKAAEWQLPASLIIGHVSYGCWELSFSNL